MTSRGIGDYKKLGYVPAYSDTEKMGELVFIEDLDLKAFLIQHGRQKAARPAGADDDDSFDGFDVAGHKIFTEFFNGLGIADKIGVIVGIEAVVAVGDDHALVAENHTDQNRRRHIHILKKAH